MDARHHRGVRAVLVTEGLVNLAVVLAKAAVGIHTASAALLSEAVHSLTDLANNLVALWVIRVAQAPPDREHPYGHQKFEMLAVFGLATLLGVLAIEIVLHAIDRTPRVVGSSTWGLALMLGVLATNITLCIWQARQARRLGSELLRADARHTFSDVLTTAVVIVGWQLAAAGYAWLDSALALAVSVLIVYLAWGLFRRAIPVLVDEMAADPDALAAIATRVQGVHRARRIRSRGAGQHASVDVVVSVDPSLSTRDSHAIADEVERVLGEALATRDITVHVEPDDSER